jgi:amino acid transporter
MTRHSVDTVSPTSGLRRNSLSALGVAILVLSAASPLIGLTGAVPAATVLGPGNATPFAYVLVGLVLLLFAVGYVAMSRKVTNAGALYAYIGRGLGMRAGLGGATVALWAYTTVQLAVYGFFGVIASGQLAAWTGLEIPWWILTLLLVAIVQVCGWLQIDVGARILLVLMALEWGIMLLMALVIGVQGGAGEGFALDQIFDVNAVLAGGFAIAIIFAFASMFGFESSAIYGEEVRNPKKSVARATYAAVIAITTFFFITSWMLIVGYGPSNSVAAAGAALESGNPAAYVFDQGARYLGPWSVDVMSVFVITSMFACTLAFHNGISRYLFTLGRDGVLPARLGTAGANGAPRTASVVQTVSVLVILLPFIVMGADPIGTLFFWGSGIAVVGILTLYFGAAVSIIAYFVRNPDSETTVWQRLIAPGLSAILLGSAIVLILSNFELLTGGTRAFALGLASTVLVALLVGVILYTVRARRLSPDAMKDLAAEVS